MTIIVGNDPYTQASFTFSHRVRRAAWNLVAATLFGLSPRPFHTWRALLLRAFGAELGADCHVYPGAKIWAPWNLVLGHRVGVADGVVLYNMAPIRVGDYAVISQGAHLCCGSHDFNSPNFQLFAKAIEIGSRAWICTEAFIHPGVTVAEGVVVGARAVVHRDLDEPWAVYAGHPAAKVSVRKRLM
jgi:putative colanic acid biosynthesis acetyltransferase WcaF